MIKIASLSSRRGASRLRPFRRAGAGADWQTGLLFPEGQTDATARRLLSGYSPCRTFAVALIRTSAGGEIDVLDPAGYGAVNITQSISIVNDGVGVAAIRARLGRCRHDQCRRGRQR